MIQTFKFLRDYMSQLNERGGPVEADYYDLDRWIRKAMDYCPTREEIEEIFGNDVLDKNSPSILNRIFYRPRGYAGSFDIMQDLYNQDILPTIPQLQMTWDAYILSQISTLAVSHRMDVVRNIALQNREKFSFLDVACGPGIACTTLDNARGLLHGDSIRYLGVDQDPDAIEFCLKHRGRNFTQYSLMGLTVKEVGTFDYVWCSGLFDYIKGRGSFLGAARRLVRLAEKTAIIGNMGPYNPSRPSMELLGWKLEYRTRAELLYMGSELMEKDTQIKRTEVKTDPTGIQHYLYIEKV